MNIVRNPSIYLWAGRFIPTVVRLFWLTALLVPGFWRTESPLMSLVFALWVLSLAVYIVWVFFVLPHFLFEESYRFRVSYFLFAGVTAGVGPVICHLLRVDRVLRQMAEAQKQ